MVLTGLVVSLDSSHLCTGSGQHPASMGCWDWTVFKESFHLQGPGHRPVLGPPKTIQASEDKTIRLWDGQGLQVAHVFPAKKHIQTYCKLSEDKHKYISYSNGFGRQGCGTTLWDLRQMQTEYEYKEHFLLHPVSFYQDHWP